MPNRTKQMNSDQRANLDAMVLALGKTMGQAWSYYYVLKGIHEGSKSSPRVAEQFPWLLDQIWRGAFDALFAKVGTVLDATSSTFSLPNLITLIRRYGNAELRGLIPEAEVCLSERGGALEKIRNWRHSNVAHRTARGDEDSFFDDNKMNLNEIEGAMDRLDLAINHLSWHVLSIHSDTKSAFEPLADQGKELFLAASNGLAGPAESISVSSQVGRAEARA
ncbi:hypothetical protein [Roseateles sp.]|uniref:AbiU2 domain-containing protein n=1 Tax=Roseateles sp. TaxID=1971397 RepID=UPI003938D6BB